MPLQVLQRAEVPHAAEVKGAANLPKVPDPVTAEEVAVMNRSEALTRLTERRRSEEPSWHQRRTQASDSKKTLIFLCNASEKTAP